MVNYERNGTLTRKLQKGVAMVEIVCEDFQFSYVKREKLWGWLVTAKSKL